MTFNEAEERAAMLWTDVSNVARLRHDPEIWLVLIEPIHGRRGELRHFMDANGHPTCHPACIAREDALGTVQPS